MFWILSSTNKTEKKEVTKQEMTVIIRNLLIYSSCGYIMILGGKRMIRKKIRKIGAITLVIGMLLTNGGVVNATEISAGDSSIVESGSLEDNLISIDNFKKDSFEELLNNSIIALSDEDGEGDSYENNDGPDVATEGRYNKVTYASLHNENDADWYKMEIDDASEPISIILTNIPLNCDYDLYLVEYSTTSGIGDVYANTETGNTTESLIGYVNKSGTYYVVVQPSSTVENNYSTSNYKLYFGDYIREGTYGYTSTGISIDFGYIATGNTTPVYKYWYSYNLSNNSQIPDGALVDHFYLSSDGNGNSWVGFYKMLGYGSGTNVATKSGGISLMYYADDSTTSYYPVKQNWLIGGYVSSSTYFTWQPKVRIVYMYGVTIDNLPYVQ